MNLLLKYEADPRVADHFNYVKKTKNKQKHAQVNLLLSYKADPRVANHFNYTALDYCVWSGYEIAGLEILGNF